MTSVSTSGSDAFLQQARRNNWRRYLESLGPAQGDAPRGWDLCVLTASDETQATMMWRQLERRRNQGMLPQHTQFFVIADPDGKRIGSGGATLRLLAAMHGTSDASPGSTTGEFPPLAQAYEPNHRVLVIHSGGDARRLPHCSAVGKLFARIPHTLPDGRASTIFDEMLINLSGVGASAPPGLLVLSGDVLLVFDHLQLSFRHRGVTGVSAAVPESLGQRHGVYVADHNAVNAFLHKPNAEQLARWHAVDEHGNVQIDTGLVWIDAATAGHLANLASEPDIRPLMDGSIADASINLYGDLLLPLAKSTGYESYLNDESDGSATPELRSARQVIWTALRETRFRVETLDPAVFVHFGSSAEYWRMVTSDASLLHLCNWSRHTASWLNESQGRCADDLVLINAVVDTRNGNATSLDGSPSPALVTDSELSDFSWRGQAILSGLRTQSEVELERDVILHQLPVEGGYVTRILGISDDPKQLYDSDRGTYLNHAFAKWIDDAGIAVTDLWPHVLPEDRSLWHARLFPVCEDRDESLAMALPLQDPAHLPSTWWAKWSTSQRISLAEGFAQASSATILEDIINVEDRVAVNNAADAIRAEQPAADIADSLRTMEPEDQTRRCLMLESLLEKEGLFVRWRGWSALTAATGDTRYEDAVFSGLAQVIEDDVVARRREESGAPFQPGMDKAKESARVEAAARIDFGGGWTDTPPYSLERDSYVLNGAVTLRGQMPIVAEATWTDERRLILSSRDIDETVEPRTAGEVLRYRNPADPFSLAKAALVLQGIVPAGTPPDIEIADVLRDLPGGIRLTTQTFIPRGSGLGTSSIMAGAVLACLNELAGARLAPEPLFDQVLSVEQMMTTGGGWQDQVGGLVGGVKMVYSAPGLPQQLQLAIQPVEVVDELDKRTFLVYTGQQRLAKNLLRSVMSQWIARDPDMVETLIALGELAREMETMLRAGDIAAFGALVAEHWKYNRRMDPDCTNPFIDELFEHLSPITEGGKLAGAGGGGFAIVIAREGVDYDIIEARIRSRYARAHVSVWPSRFPDQGLVYA